MLEFINDIIVLAISIILGLYFFYLPKKKGVKTKKYLGYTFVAFFLIYGCISFYKNTHHSISAENNPSIGIRYTPLEIYSNKQLVVKLHLQNYGHSSATNVAAQTFYRFHTVPSISEFVIDSKFNLSLPNLEPTMEKILLITDDWILSDSMYVRFTQQRLYLFVYGVIRYSNKNGELDSTLFCARYNVHSKVYEDVEKYHFKY
jgi:hypothetical protein